MKVKRHYLESNLEYFTLRSNLYCYLDEKLGERLTQLSINYKHSLIIARAKYKDYNAMKESQTINNIANQAPTIQERKVRGTG